MPIDHVNALPPGTRFEEYRLDTVLGAGGFGITYRAYGAHLDKFVSIDKLTEISPFWLRFVFAHKIQFVDYHSNLFFNRV